jgi:membrane protease YdiL (CAAX protease family)
MLESKVARLSSIIGFCFAFLFMSEILPFVFRLTYHPINSPEVWGMPAIIRFIMGNGDVDKISHSLGMLLGAGLALKASRIFLREPIRFGLISYQSIAWIFFALMIGIFAPKIFNQFANVITLQTITYTDVVPIFKLPSLTAFEAQNLILQVLPTVLLAPCTEEVLYRGFLTNFMLRYFQILPAAILVSLIFTLSHYLTISSSGRAITLFLAGILLFAARMKTRGIGTPMLMHIAHNAFVVFFIE